MRVAEQRWGDTDAWRQSHRRTATYGKDDWRAIRQEADEIESRFAAALAAGQSPAGDGVLDIAEEHRRQHQLLVLRLPPATHRDLGEM